MHKTMTRLATAAAIALLVTGIGFAQGGDETRPAGRARMGDMQGPGPRGGGLERLNLTADQREQVKQLMEAEREANREKREQMIALQRQLHEAIFLEKGNASEVGQQIGELEAQMLQARIAHMQKLAAILTPEQRKEMAAAAPRGPGRRGPGGMAPGRLPGI